ncbi:MAG: MAPEG family protein [Gammaproteobacteria bacterium]|nr:MAPEG family protein [Gammaproteobacteria bacterium]MCP5139083.1 MAPEG family protein [Chromatiales bacterium]
MVAVHVVIALALIQFFVFGALVGRARVKYQVDAPAITGHPVFERYYRVHYNTMEQLVSFVPGMLLFGTYVSATGAAILGLVFIAGRLVYLRLYIADPKKRGAGFGISVLPIMILILGGLGGAIWSALG